MHKCVILWYFNNINTKRLRNSGLLLIKVVFTSMLVKILQSAMMDFYCVINLFYIILEAQRLEAEILWHVDQTDEENM